MLFFSGVNPVFWAGRPLRRSRPVPYRFRRQAMRFASAPCGAGLLLGAAGLLASVACARDARPTPVRPHVLLVTIDTLRADRLGCYGYRAAVTPNLDGLAARGARVAVAGAHAPLTAPS